MSNIWDNQYIIGHLYLWAHKVIEWLFDFAESHALCFILLRTVKIFWVYVLKVLLHDSRCSFVNLVIVQDMAAHSACDFGGGKAEKLALAKYRQAIWQGRVLNSQFTDEELRNQGRCPLTPEEIGLLLAALGFDNSTRLYLASHKVCYVSTCVV